MTEDQAFKPFSYACDMEKHLVGIRNFASALVMIAEGMDDKDAAVVVQELAWGIRERVEEAITMNASDLTVKADQTPEKR